MTLARGCAEAPGGISIVNALATGRGASMAVDLVTRAEVTLLAEPGVSVEITSDRGESPDLARETVMRVLRAHDAGDLGARVVTTSTIPVSRGLKSSSAAANAIALATDAAVVALRGGGSLGHVALLAIGIDASFAAKVTVTGAYDDSHASMFGGIAVTDNRERRLIRADPPPEDVHILIRVPAEKIRKTQAGAMDYARVKEAVGAAHALAAKGAHAEAMQANGDAYGAFYGVDAGIVQRARDAGARAVSVSGTGPAVAALVPVDALDAVRAVLSEGSATILQTRPRVAGAGVIPC